MRILWDEIPEVIRSFVFKASVVPILYGESCPKKIDFNKGRREPNSDR